MVEAAASGDSTTKIPAEALGAVARALLSRAAPAGIGARAGF
jgi:hypothetical protein